MSDDTKEPISEKLEGLDKRWTIDKSGDYMDTLLMKADGAGLLWEVVYFGLRAMKRDPSLDEADALSIGYHEWVK